MTDLLVAYFDPDKNVKIFTDASSVGLRAVLTQVDKLNDCTLKRTTVTYASRALTRVKSRYSQTERFHFYVYGIDFTVVTDHQSLLPMFRNLRAKLPGRVERWQLRLQPYKIKLVLKPGVKNPADFLSRHMLPYEPRFERNAAKEYVNYMLQ